MPSTRDLLKTLHVDADALDAREPAWQWRDIRSAFLKRALETHPDKDGGDAATFDAVHSAFETLRALCESGAAKIKLDLDATPPTRAAGMRPSAELFREALAAGVPLYKAEISPSGRATCIKSKLPIPKGELRCGSLVPEAGTYGRWSAIDQWRVPQSLRAIRDAPSIEAGLRALDEVIVTGVAALPDEAFARLVAHLENADNWARESKKKSAVAARAAETVREATAASDADSTPPTPSTAVAARTSEPADGLPEPNGQFAAKTFVLSGEFDALPGLPSVGLARGKGAVKVFVERYGGRVVGSVSRKTAYLVVGAAPGARKVQQANEFGVQVVDAAGVTKLLRGEAADAVTIGAFSSGFGGNGAAGRLGEAALDRLRAQTATKRLRDDELEADHAAKKVAV